MWYELWKEDDFLVSIGQVIEQSMWQVLMITNLPMIYKSKWVDTIAKAQDKQKSVKKKSEKLERKTCRKKSKEILGLPDLTVNIKEYIPYF